MAGNLKTFGWQMNMGASADIHHNTTEVKFGDGYVQRVSHGIHTQRTDWSGEKTGEFNTVIKPILDFLGEHGGVKPFWWENPHHETAKYICKSYSVRQRKGNFWQINFKFEQVF